jgi:molybdate transport system substrate-binding protein
MAAPSSGVTLRILTSNSTHALLKALAPEFERASGNRIEMAADSAKMMLERIGGGETGDVAVLGTSAIDDLVKAGVILPASCRPFARARVGVAVRAGAPKPDISSVEALKRALLAARSIAHTEHGASGMYVPVLLKRLGIAEQMKSKTVTRPGGLIARVVVAGEAELAVQQIPELVAVPGAELVGPLPDEVQKVFETTAGIFASSAHADAAAALLRYFASPDAASTFREKGLEPAQA